jgi:hypothetical protein
LKNEAKNFCESALSHPGKTKAKSSKSFLLLFFKKEVLPFSLCGVPNEGRLAQPALDI